MRTPLSPDLAGIMEAGVLAPSADNRHCFEFQVTSSGVALVGRDDYITAPYHRRILNQISLGAVVENMIIRANHLGYGAEPSWQPEPSRPSLIAEIRLARDAPLDDGLDAAIGLRHTNRRIRFSGPPLDGTELARFTQLIRNIPGVSLSFCDAGWQRSELLRLVWRAEAERFAVQSLHEDLFASVRFDVGWHESATEGLPPAALGVEPGARWAFARLRHWRLMKALSHAGMHHAIGFRAAGLPARLAPHRGILTTSLSPEQGSFAVGRALQRTWLRAISLGLAFQPLAGAALLALPDYAAVGRACGERLRRGWKTLTHETPLMVFRMGYARPPSNRSGRPPLDYFLRS